MKKITILFLLCITSICFAGIPIDSVNAWKRQADKLKTDLNTYETIRIYAKAKSLTGIPIDSVNAWKNQAAKDKIDLNTYITGLILLTPAGGGSGSITGTLTTNYIPVATGTNSIGNSTILQQTDNIKFNKGNILLGGLATFTSVPAVYMGVTPTVQNYSFAKNNGLTYLNGENGLLFGINGTDNGSLQLDGYRFNNNVGIGVGTAAPTKALDVRGTFQSYLNTSSSLVYNNAGELFLNGLNGGIAGGSYMQITSIPSRAYNLIRSSSDLGISADGTYSNLIIKNNGNVGINTETPGAKLEIANPVYTSSVTLLEVKNNYLNHSVFKITDIGSSGGSAITSDFGYWGLGTPADSIGGNRLTIKGSGSSSSTGALAIFNSSGQLTFLVFDNGQISAPHLPTSSVGLPSGSIYVDGGNILKIVP